MIRKWIANNDVIAVLIVLTIISAVTYLPLIGQIGYVNDDWYLMYSAGAYGPEAFIDIFSVDRPGRALVMIPAYKIFGGDPLYYNLSAYAFHLVSAFAFFWLLRMLFPDQKKISFVGSLLFLIYPGFLSQINGLDYQSHIVALAAALLSIDFTIKAVLSDRSIVKITCHALSVPFGLLYLSQMEWYIGFEVFRWACVLLISSRRNETIVQTIVYALRTAYPAIIAPALFLIWRLFFFQAERSATDVDLQFEQARLYPIQTLYHWTVQVLQDLFDVILGAWVIPLSQLTSYIQRWGGVLTVITVCVFILFFYFQDSDKHDDTLPRDFTNEAMILGIVIAIGGLIPIAMVNREVSFPSFSRYSLVSSAGVALFFAALFLRLRGQWLQYGLIAFLLASSMLTHHANSFKAAQQTALTNDFWWQVSWRVPQFEKATTLIASYPDIALEEDYFIWGPANLIYYPEKQNDKNIQPGLFAAILNRDTVNKVLTRERQEYDNRKTITTYTNYRNMAVLTQPSLNSCVHVLDGFRPEYSRNEQDSIRMIGSYSEIEHVLVNETPHTPPSLVFGAEPDHGWCYYYQKADLARQRGDWDEVQRIGKQAFEQELAPKDLIEWMPFLQAYAVTGDVVRLAELAPIIAADPYISQQTCQIIGGMNGLSESVLEIVDTAYCLDN
jgi:hypothetical protein